MPQGFVLGPLLFLIYIKDLHNIIIYSNIHHFADDTNLLCASKSIKDINRKVNFDLKNIIYWLKANKISLNADKTELILFRSKNKVITKNPNFQISCQKIHPLTQTKCLSITLDENLKFEKHMELLKTKLNRANGLLSKIRHLVSKNLLRTIYFAIFDSNLRYGCQILGQKDSREFKSITTVQNKGLWILNFKGPLEHSSQLYKNSKILKLIDLIKLNNILFTYGQINSNLPNALENYFQLKRQQHNHFRRGKLLNVPQVNTSLYGSNSITLPAIRDWNALHGQSGLELIIAPSR